MRKLIGVAVVVFMVSALGLAGEKAAPEVYGGYQFTSTDGGWHASGWNGAANMYLTRWLGVTGDFSGVYKSGSNLYTYTAGPVVSKRKGNFSPYAHALFGGAHAGVTGGYGDSGMAMTGMMPPASMICSTVGGSLRIATSRPVFTFLTFAAA